MSSAISANSVEIRDRRLHTILSFQGDAQALCDLEKEQKKKPKKLCYGQCSQCQESCAMGELYPIHDSAVIAHAPIGCYATVSRSYITARSVVKQRGKDHFDNEAICTNIQEKDTIYGAAEKLRGAIREAYRRYHPKVIFVTTSCASGIIGDDVESVADEMSEELQISVVPVSCEGFKSKVWATGFDAAFHGVLKYVVQPPKKKQADVVNVFNFDGTDTFSPLLNPLGLKVKYLPAQASVAEFAEISEAACTATICETLATYVAAKLEEAYGVPQVRAASPYGIGWTDDWLREVAKLTDKTDIVENFIESEHRRIEKDLTRLRRELAGKRVYVFAGDSYAHNMGNIATDLGMQVVGMTTYHHDQNTDNDEVNTLKYMIQSIGNVDNYTICTKNPYQVIKMLRKLKPDVLIVRHQDLSILGYKAGIPTVFEADSNKSVGYNGIVELGERILRVFKTRKLIDNIAEHAKLPYTDWWLDENTDPFYFAK